MTRTQTALPSSVDPDHRRRYRLGFIIAHERGRPPREVIHEPRGGLSPACNSRARHRTGRL